MKIETATWSCTIKLVVDVHSNSTKKLIFQNKILIVLLSKKNWYIAMHWLLLSELFFLKKHIGPQHKSSIS